MSSASLSPQSADRTRPAPPSLVRAVTLHAQDQLLELLRLQRIWPAAALLSLLTVVSGFQARAAPGDKLAAVDFFASFAMPLLTMMAIGYGAASIRNSGDRGAATLYLLRPRGSLAWPLGTWLANVTVVCGACIVAVASTLLAATISVTPQWGHVVPMVVAATLNGMVWTTIAMAAASFFARGAAVCVLWLVVGDSWLAKGLDSVAAITPGPALKQLINLPPEHLLLSSNSPAAAAQIVVITAVALGVLIWRIDRTPPS